MYRITALLTGQHPNYLPAHSRVSPLSRHLLSEKPEVTAHTTKTTYSVSQSPEN